MDNIRLQNQVCEFFRLHDNVTSLKTKFPQNLKANFYIKPGKGLVGVWTCPKKTECKMFQLDINKSFSGALLPPFSRLVGGYSIETWAALIGAQTYAFMRSAESGCLFAPLLRVVCLVTIVLKVTGKVKGKLKSS